MSKKDKTAPEAEAVEKKENAEAVEKGTGQAKEEADGIERQKDDSSQFEERLNQLLTAIEERDKRLESLEKVLSEQKDLIANKTAKEKIGEIHDRKTEVLGYYDFSKKSITFNTEADAASYNKSKEYYNALGIAEYYRKTRLN